MIKIRKAEKTDCKDLFYWRNNKTTIQMSHNQNTISWNDHKEWFNNTLDNINKVIFICEDDVEFSKVGVVRFDVKQNFALISINLSPNMRGKGKSAPCIEASIKKLKQLFPSVFLINAEVKKENLISKRLFNKCGFELDRMEGDIFHYIYKIH